MNEMKLLVLSLLALQLGLIFLGLYWIQQEAQLLIAVGWFHIIFNLLFGALNVVTFRRS